MVNGLYSHAMLRTQTFSFMLTDWIFSPQSAGYFPAELKAGRCRNRAIAKSPP
jgi:hypothetical protein